MSSQGGVLSDHTRVGKKFYPPGRVAFWREVNYVERIIPEIAWIQYFIQRLGTITGMACVTSFIEACHQARYPEKLELTLCSNYRALDEMDWGRIRRRLRAIDNYLQSLDALTPFVRCFPKENPMRFLSDELKASSPSNADIAVTREVVSSLFDRRSKSASIAQAVMFKVGIASGMHHVPADYPYAEFGVLTEDFDSEHAKATAAHVRMHANFIYGVWAEKIGDGWSRYFWNRCREFAPLDADNHRHLPIEDPKLHPAMRLGLDFERYAWTVVDRIWERLPVDIYESETFEVLGALLARQCNLAAKLFRNVELWDYHTGPLFLRPMTDSVITVAWILKDPLDRARKFISHGLGQEKLTIEHLKLAAAKEEGDVRLGLEEGIAAREAWLNSQHYSFLQVVDVGSWSGISTRKMADEAGCSSLYTFAYTGWSHAAHGTWNHIGKFDVWPSPEPLHKYVLQPASVEHGYHIDVLQNAASYFNETCVRLVEHFKIEMDLTQPSDWLSARLEQFSREMDELEAATSSTSPAEDQPLTA